MTTVTRTAVFPADQVAALLEVAEAAGNGITLAKDEGAYLMTHHADGTPAEPIVYAEGHAPPPRPSSGFEPDDPWIVARAATEQTWGGDDFAETFTVAEIRNVLGPTGIRAVLDVEEIELPAQYPTGPWGRRDPVCHLEAMTLEPV